MPKALPIPLSSASERLSLLIVAMAQEFKPSALIRFVEIAHCADLNLDGWCRALAEEAERLTGRDVTLGLLRRDAESYSVLKLLTKVPGGADTLSGMFREAAPLLDPYFVKCPRHLVSVHSVGSMVGGVPGAILEYLGTVEIEDEVGLVSNAGDRVMFLSVPGLRMVDLSEKEVSVLTRLVLHAESNLRLRLDPESEVAIIDPQGKVLHASLEEASANLEPLRRHVETVERCRRQRTRTTIDALEAWMSLVEGRWGLVERVDSDGKRYYSILETHDSRRMRALSKQESSLVELGARGLLGKEAAYALGITPSTASRRLSVARQKLGFTSTTAMIRTVARFLGATGRDTSVELTDAERSVLELVHLGWSNDRIARERGRSENTVANQVSSILRKMNAPSRRHLERRQF